MSAAVQTLATAMSTDMNYYAGDPALLKSNKFADQVEEILRSDRADQLTARVAIHVQLREAFKTTLVQSRLKPYLDPKETFDTYISDSKARAKFFTNKQQALKAVILASEEQRALKEAHGELAAWENDNAVLLRHQMFMTYLPSQALLLESAATVALYRQYASLEENEYTSESSEGEIPQMLRKMGGNDKPYYTESTRGFQVDEHNKMFSQQVLQNKRVEYEEKREKVAKLRNDLEASESVRMLESFIRIRNDIFKEFGIDRLASLCSRSDKDLADPNEGGIDASIRGLPASDEFVVSCRAAQYSLAKIVETCHKNYLNILSVDDWDAMMTKTGRNAREIIEKVRPLKDVEVFRYWFLSCITADCPQTGPNKIVGKNTICAEDYKKFWFPQKSSYVPSLNTSSRTHFGTKVADRRCLPHIVIISPATYSYRENNDPDSIRNGQVDLMVYDMTNEKVLLMITNSSDERKPRGAFLNAQEERYRFAAVVRSAITYENEYHGFECRGVVAEYFFNPQEGPEENFYCVMAPNRISQKVPTEVVVPVKAFRPFTACPPRYFVLGSNWGVTAGVRHNPYPASYSSIQLNAAAIALSDIMPAKLVEENVLRQLLNHEEGMAQLEREVKERQAEQSLKQQQSPRARTPRAGAAAQQQQQQPMPDPSDPAEILAREKAQGPVEDADPLGPMPPKDALHPVRDILLKNRRQWPAPSFYAVREGNADLRRLPAVRDGNLRTPLNVFTDLMMERFPSEAQVEESAPPSARASMSARGRGGVNHKNADRQAANVAWF